MLKIKWEVFIENFICLMALCKKPYMCNRKWLLMEIFFSFLLGSTYGRLGADPKNRRHFCYLQIYLKICTKGRPNCYSKLSSFSCSVEMDFRPNRLCQYDARFSVLYFLCTCSENNHLNLYWALLVSLTGKKLGRATFFRNLLPIWSNHFDHKEVHFHILFYFFFITGGDSLVSLK